MSGNQSETFPNSRACVFQWNYPVINLGRNEYRNCCRTSTNRLSEGDLEKYGKDIVLNSPVERENRARMLLGEKIGSCSTCWMIEEKGVRSPRIAVDLKGHTSVKDFALLKKQIDALPSQNEKVQFLAQHDVTFSRRTNMLEIVLKNTCDMQCMYCSHHYSSRWAAERIKYNEIRPEEMATELPKADEQFKEKFLEWFRTEGAYTVNYVNFLGGEPSIIKEFYEISQEIAEILRNNSQLKVTLGIVTNLNSTPEVFNKFITYLQSVSPYFSKIDLNISIEAMGERAEYIRHGLNWNRWKSNFENLLKMKPANTMISMQMATNILSISSLPELIEYFWQMTKKHNIGIGLRQNLVSIPHAHSPMLLTKDFARYLEQSIEILEKRFHQVDPYFTIYSDPHYCAWQNYAQFLVTIKSAIEKHELSEGEKKLVRDFYNQYDERRNLNIYETFPEYRSFLKDCSVRERVTPKGKKTWIQKLLTIRN